MKFYLQIACLLSSFGALMFTVVLYGKGLSWPRIWNETFILWLITLIIFIVYFIKFSNSLFTELSNSNPRSSLFLIMFKSSFISLIVILKPCPAKG